MAGQTPLNDFLKKLLVQRDTKTNKKPNGVVTLPWRLHCSKTQIIRNFRLYIIQVWKPFFHIFTHGDAINAQTWEVSPPKQSSFVTKVA